MVILTRLGHPLTDEQVVLLTGVLDDVFIHLVASHAKTATDDDTAQSYHGHLGGTAANIDDHAAQRLGDGQSSADGGGHGLFDQISLARASRKGCIVDGSLFDLGHA